MAQTVKVQFTYMHNGKEKTGYYIRTKFIGEQTWEEIREKLRMGVTKKRICQDYGICYNTLMKHI